MAAEIEQQDLQLLHEQVNSLLANEPYEDTLKDTITFYFDRPKDLLTLDVFSLLLKPASALKTLEGHTDYVNSVAFSPDSKLLASASTDNTIRLWNIPRGHLHAELKGHTNRVLSLAFSPDGQSIVSGSGDRTVRTWSVATNQQVQTLNGHSGWVRSVAWSPNGDLIASGSGDTTVILWDASSGSMNKKLTVHTNEVYSVSFSQNGNKLASASNKLAPDRNELASNDHKTVIIWDVDSGAFITKLTHPEAVCSVCFSPDDQFIVTGCCDNIVRMFNVNNGREEKRFEGHTKDVNSVAISFDGSMIASGSKDKSVRLWDVASTKQLQQLDRHTNIVWSVAFSRDGKFIASGSKDTTICFGNAPLLLQIPHQAKEQYEENEESQKTSLIKIDQ